MTIQAIIFDLDGTLVDSERDIMTSVLVAFADQGLNSLTLEDMKAYVGFPLVELYNTLMKEQPRHGLERFVRIYRAHYCDHCADYTRPFPGVEETLDALAERTLCVATAKPSWSAIQILERLGLAQRFKFILGSEGLAPKPDPAIVHECLRRLNLPPDRVAMVGDTNRDILAAQAAGVRAIAATWGGWSKERLAELKPDALPYNFSAIAQIV